MFASSQPGLQYTQSFLKQCFSNSKSCSKGKSIAWGSTVGRAVQVGGAGFFVWFGVFSVWFLVFYFEFHLCFFYCLEGFHLVFFFK